MPFLRVALVYLSAAVVVVPLATRLGLGSVLGYLVAGVVIGPHGLGLAGDAEQVLPVAEFGVVLLLFLVGLELDPRRLLAMRRDALAGALQVVVTTAAIGAGALALGVPWRGALVAGLGLSLSSTALVVQLLEERRELEADIAPFKGLLLGLFFLAVGMSADVSLLARRPLAVAGTVAALVVAKGVVGAALGRPFLGRAEPAIALGVLLSQGGEFAFVLFRLAARQGAMEGEAARLLVLAVTLSMATTPALFALHRRVVRRRLEARPARAFDALPDEEPPVIIAGFGRVGQVVGRVLAARRIPFTAIDASAEHIDFIRRFGNRVFYGDVSRLDLLRAARVDRARIFVLALDDVEASVRTAELVRIHFPDVRILARARNRQHAYRLRRLGIEDITRETFAASLDLTAEVLEGLGVARDLARVTVERFRAHDEALFERSWRHQDDLEKLTDIARSGREELEKLFEADLRDEGRRSA